MLVIFVICSLLTYLLAYINIIAVTANNVWKLGLLLKKNVAKSSGRYVGCCYLLKKFVEFKDFLKLKYIYLKC